MTEGSTAGTSQRLRVLVVGAGSIGERHARCLLATGRAEVAICEPVTAVRERVAAAYALAGAYASIDAALDAGWDTAVVATPAQTHIPLALQVVRSGASALIEKPLAVDPDGVEVLAGEAERRGLPVGVAYVYRAHPMLAAMRGALASGRFGRPLQLTVVAGQHFPAYRPAYASTYYARHASGGGAIQDALTHLLNAAEWLVGPITRLAAEATHCVLATPDVEDTVSILARHGAVLATYSLNQHQAPNECTITVVCERGTCRFLLHRHAWGWMTDPGAEWREEAVSFVDRDDWFVRQEASWLDTVEHGGEPLCTLREGLQTLRCNRAALASVAAEGAWQTIPQEIAA